MAEVGQQSFYKCFDLSWVRWQEFDKDKERIAYAKGVKESVKSISTLNMRQKMFLYTELLQLAGTKTSGEEVVFDWTLRFLNIGRTGTLSPLQFQNLLKPYVQLLYDRHIRTDEGNRHNKERINAVNVLRSQTPSEYYGRLTQDPLPVHCASKEYLDYMLKDPKYKDYLFAKVIESPSCFWVLKLMPYGFLNKAGRTWFLDFVLSLKPAERKLIISTALEDINYKKYLFAKLKESPSYLWVIMFVPYDFLVSVSRTWFQNFLSKLSPDEQQMVVLVALKYHKPDVKDIKPFFQLLSKINYHENHTLVNIDMDREIKDEHLLAKQTYHHERIKNQLINSSALPTSLYIKQINQSAVAIPIPVSRAPIDQNQIVAGSFIRSLANSQRALPLPRLALTQHPSPVAAIPLPFTPVSVVLPETSSLAPTSLAKDTSLSAGPDNKTSADAVKAAVQNTFVPTAVSVTEPSSVAVKAVQLDTSLPVTSVSVVETSADAVPNTSVSTTVVSVAEPSSDAVKAIVPKAVEIEVETSGDTVKPTPSDTSMPVTLVSVGAPSSDAVKATVPKKGEIEVETSGDTVKPTPSDTSMPVTVVSVGAPSSDAFLTDTSMPATSPSSDAFLTDTSMPATSPSSDAFLTDTSMPAASPSSDAFLTDTSMPATSPSSDAVNAALPATSILGTTTSILQIPTTLAQDTSKAGDALSMPAQAKPVLSTDSQEQILSTIIDRLISNLSSPDGQSSDSSTPSKGAKTDGLSQHSIEIFANHFCPPDTAPSNNTKKDSALANEGKDLKKNVIASTTDDDYTYPSDDESRLKDASPNDEDYTYPSDDESRLKDASPNDDNCTYPSDEEDNTKY